MTPTTETTPETHSEQQARAQLESIKEMVQNLFDAQEKDDFEAIDEANERIQEDPLSIEIREDWHTVGERSPIAEYKILLCTGGPAVRIVGELSEYLEPQTAWLESQDWGIPWTRLHNITEAEQAALLTYAQLFYFGS